ncbi:HEPN domain-containing protein [Mesorhizobium australicum]|uniref:Uncharacterized protein n=1 Tax=Mesorhizobium australicum TaxID=536018 RepID=A0A1X7PH27_9HYPH|nr:HEPN domain-containing protein [Mesorhizobium australicum]SMH50842.1 hypothetical protein SAMN02982922_4276 [Mesorhizobium australicum]
MRGIEIKDTVNIDKYISIKPFADFKYTSMNIYQQPFSNFHGDAILQIEFEGPPVLERMGQSNAKNFRHAQALADEVMRAFSLIPKCLAYMTVRWAEHPNWRDHPRPGHGFSSGSRPFPHYRKGSVFDGDVLMSAWQNWISYDEKRKEKLHVPLERIMLSAAETHVVDKLIDLSIALESMLLDGEQGELAYKIAVRGAWLISRNPSERIENYKLIKKLYGMRSKAVHTGNLAKESGRQNGTLLDAELGIEIARDVAKKILSIGKMDWEKLVLDA